MALARIILALPAVLAALTAARPAAAQTSPSNSAAAEALFRDAHRLLAEGEVRGACEKFGASQRLDPALGTLINLALCHKQEGKTASAWAEFVEAAAVAEQTGQGARGRYARKRALEIEPLLTRILIVVPASPHSILLTIDGAPLGEGVSGTPIPIDPGVHVVEASILGGTKSWSKRIELSRQGTTTRVDVPSLGLEPDVGAVAPARAGGSGSGNPTKRVAGIAVVAAGVGALVLSGVYASTSISRADSARGPLQDARPAHLQYGEELSNQAALLRTYAILAGSLGAAAVGVGVILVLSAGARAPATPTTVHLGPHVDDRGGGFVLFGAF